VNTMYLLFIEWIISIAHLCMNLLYTTSKCHVKVLGSLDHFLILLTNRNGSAYR
jgi:hypothetical protein